LREEWVATRMMDKVRAFWNAHPVASAAIPHSLGSREYFQVYDRLREANESLAWSYALHEYRQFAGRYVLDVGSGNGYVLGKYAEKGARVYGVDLTQTAIDLCRRRFQFLGLPGHFCAASAEELPFSDDAFDCVCCMGVLHHTPNPARAAREIFRVTRPGGRLVVMLYHRNSALYRLTFPLLRMVTGKSLQQLVNEVDGVGNPKGEIYSRAELRRLLGQFENLTFVVGLLQRWMLPPVLRNCLSERALQRLSRWCGWFLYAKGNKPLRSVRAGGRPDTWPGVAPRSQGGPFCSGASTSERRGVTPSP
jgi:2-polyprenyl-3-methyl-5-hydroxy-6-metoxy-1,4-benzoquinol methylase